MPRNQPDETFDGDDEESEAAWMAALAAARARAEEEAPPPAKPRLSDSVISSVAFSQGWSAELPPEEAAQEEHETPLPIEDAAIDAWLAEGVPEAHEDPEPAIEPAEPIAHIEADRARAPLAFAPLAPAVEKIEEVEEVEAVPVAAAAEKPEEIEEVEAAPVEHIEAVALVALVAPVAHIEAVASVAPVEHLEAVASVASVARIEAVAPVERIEAVEAEAPALELAPEIVRLVARLRAGQCVLCAGPRLTVGQPDLRERIAQLLNTLPDEETEEIWPVVERHPLAAAGFVRRRLGDGFAGALKESAGGNEELSEAVRRLGALPFRAVVTTAFDDTVERAVALSGFAPRVYTPSDAAQLRSDGHQPFVLKALGDASRAETVVWSSEELRAVLADGDFRAATHELYQSRSFLWVGFDGGDLDLEILLERVLAGAQAGEIEHFAVLPGLSAVERDELERAWGIHVLAEADPAALAETLHAALAEPRRPGLPADGDHEGWLALYAEDPSHAEAAAQLDRLTDELHERGDHDRLIDLLLGRVAVEPDPDKRADTLLTVARILEHETEDPARALTALLAAYKERPERAAWHELERLAGAAAAWDDLVGELGDALASLPVAVRAPLHRRLGRFAELGQALDELAAEAGEVESRAARIEAAELHAEKLGDRSAAIARYEALAADLPQDVEILRALERLYEAEGRSQDYLENVARQADIANSDGERAALYRRLALLWEEEPDGATPAETAWETLLALEPHAEDGLRALARLYRKEGKWPELVETLRRQAALEAAPEQAERFGEIGAIYEHELGDLERAVAAYLTADAARPTEESEIALTRVYEQLGDHPSLVELLDRRARRATESGGDPIPFVLRAAELCADKLGDPRGAERRFARVLELEPTHAQAMIALAATYRQSRELLRAAKLLVEAVEHTPNRLERTRLLIDAGRIYEEIEDDERASELYLAALAIDPEAEEAGERVVELLWSAERYAELLPVVEMLTLKPASPEVQLERWLRLGRAAEAVGLEDKAGKAFVRAAELAPSHLEAQRGCAAHHLARERWAEALSSFELVFRYHIDALPEPERVALFSDMARCELKLGAREGASELVARALELDPTHRPSLYTQLELGSNEPAALIDAKRALLATAGTDERVQLLGEIGDLRLAELSDVWGALDAWREALALRPEDHKLLHKCLEAYVGEGAWAQAVEVLERLISVETVAPVRARYHHTAGLICRDELQLPREAAAHLRAALDSDPDFERASQALEELFVTTEDWRELARHYRAGLKRLGALSPGDTDGKNGERLRVWSKLAEVCLEKLADGKSAIAALEAALSFDRDNLDRHKRLADLYVQAGPAFFEKSIAEHQHILGREKNRVLSYRALKHLYIQTSQRDKSVLCSYALELLHKGEPDDAGKVAEYKKRPLATARRLLGDDGWARLVHPDEDRLLDCLFALVGPTLVAGQAQPHKSFGLLREDALSIDDPHSYAKVLKYITTIYDVAPPEAYARPEQKEPIVFANCLDGRELVPVFLLGQPLIGDRRREAEQVFEIARKVALLRPERILRLAMPHPQQIGHVIEAAMALGDDDAQPGSGELERTVLGLKRVLPQVQLEQVVAIGRKLRAVGTDPESAALAWLQATDLTAARAGWALTGDLESCARLIAAEGQPAGTLAPTQRLLDLVWSSTSEELFAVRKQLGLM
ncbi:MAG TPA: SIR2 family protein [Polyangia bacterium]